MMKTCILILGLTLAALHAESIKPTSPLDILTTEPLLVVLASVPSDRAREIESAVAAWFTRAPHAPIDEHQQIRDRLLGLLYTSGNAPCLAFADSFVPDSSSSARRPHPETTTELMLSIAFGMPKSTQWGDIEAISRDDQRETLSGQVAVKTVRLRKLLGLPEIPLLELYKSVPRDQETLMPWLLSLAKEARTKQSDIAEIEVVFAKLQQADEGHTTTQASSTSPSPLQPPAQKVEHAAKSKQSASSELATGSTPWIVWAVMIVTATGLLWLMLKRRTK
jgi:hypothetical protein